MALFNSAGHLIERHFQTEHQPVFHRHPAVKVVLPQTVKVKHSSDSISCKLD